MLTMDHLLLRKECVLQIIELGEGFMDPDTGEMLGQDETCWSG